MNTDEDHAQRTEQAAFVYGLTLADVQGVVRVRARRTGAGRVETLLPPLVATALVVAFALFRGLLPAVVVAGAVLGLGAGYLGVVRARRGMARRLHAVWASYGQCRTVVDDRGAVTTGETMSYTADWKLFTHYAETPDLFVLVGGPRASLLAVLPKRGAEGPGDVDRLRAILDRSLRGL